MQWCKFEGVLCVISLQNLGKEFLQAGVPGMIEHFIGGALFHDLTLIHKEDHDCACEDGSRMRVSRFVMFSLLKFAVM